MVTREVSEKFLVVRGARLIDLREEEGRVVATLRRLQHEVSLGRRPTPPSVPTLPSAACPHCKQTYGLLLNKRRACPACGGPVCSLCLRLACPRCLAVERRASERAARARLLQPQAASAAWYAEARLHSEDLPADLAALHLLLAQVEAGRPDLLARAQRQDRSLAALFAAFEVSYKKLETLPANTAREAALVRNFRAGFAPVLAEQLPDYRLQHRRLQELVQHPPPAAEPEPAPPPALTVASVSSVALPLAGATVTMEGSGFTPELLLKVGRRPAQLLVESPTRLLATLPPHKPGQHTLTLSLPGRTYTVPVPVLYTAEISSAPTPTPAPAPPARNAPDIAGVEPTVLKAGDRAKITLGPATLPKELEVEIDGRKAAWSWAGTNTIVFTCPELVGVNGPVELCVRNLELNVASVLRDALIYEGKTAGRAWGSKGLGTSPPQSAISPKSGRKK